jgi:hypothetical protein
MSNNKKLKSLEFHNAERINFNYSMYSNLPQFNGIACPECGEELLDKNPMITLNSNPPKKSVHCSKCTYQGYRIA